MAKTAKLKKKPASANSRASRRAESPSLNLDKSTTSVKPPVDDAAARPAVLGAQNAGISKRKKQKPMSRQQRLRHQKGLERADIVIDKTEKKIAKSAIKGKVVKERSAAWEDLNGKITGEIQPAKLPKLIDRTHEDAMEEDAGWEDVSEEAVVVDQATHAVSGAEREVKIAEEPLPSATDDLDEVL
ncbi:Alb1-domain-containing protein [Cryomyces antarcticus]